MDIKVWISKEKDMIAFYTDKACIDIFLQKSDIPEDMVSIEYYIGDKLIKRDILESGKELLTFKDIESFLLI